MSDSKGEEKPSFTVSKFKGNFIEFESQINAYVILKGSQVTFKPDKAADYYPESEEVMSDNEVIRRKERSFVRKNLQAIVVLSIAFAKNPQYLALNRNSRTSEWPRGRAWFIIETLRQKFLPHDGLTHFDAEKMLSEVHIYNSEEPTDFKDHLVDVQCRYPQDIKDRQVLNQFLCGCDGKYKSSILQIYRDNPDVDAHTLSEKLQIDHRLSETLEATLSISTDPETLLTQSDGPLLSSRSYAPDASDKNKVCYSCGLRGHLARNCPA